MNIRKYINKSSTNDKMPSKEQFKIIPVFPTTLVKTNIGRSFTKEETDCIANIPLQKKIGEPKHWSECFEIFDNFAEELKDIKKICEYHLKRYLEEIEGVDTDLTMLRITRSWLNKIEPQGHHPIHNHRNSHLSGILYISCLPTDHIQFTDRNRMCYTTLELPKKKMTEFNIEGASVAVKEGDLVLFPSLVLHQVGVNDTKDKERISLSFDTYPTYLPSLYPPFK